MSSSSSSPTLPRLFITSDLHYGVSEQGDRNTRALAAFVCDHHAQADALCLIGDLGKDPHTLAACLDLFAAFPGPRLAVPGNHDVWLHGWPQSADSWRLHEELLPALFRDRGFHPLHLEPFTLPNTLIVGSMGWYDYSFRDDIGVPLEAYASKTPPWARGPIWNDARFARFPYSDPELTDLLCQRLADQLTSDPTLPHCLAFIHHLTHKRLLVHPRIIVPQRWRFANAFLGANALGQTLEQDPRPSQVFCGHIHMPRTHKTDQLTATCVGSDYRHKELILASPTEIISKSMFEED